jgi:hypothetical protein
MSFFNASKKQEDVQQGGSNHITASGVYPVTLLAPVVSISKGGSQTVDLFVRHNGQDQIVYGNLRVTNNDGSPNKIGAKIFNQLLIIAGLDSVADPIDAELPIGKGGAMKECSVLEDLADLDVVMRVQMEYSKYNGNIQEKKIVKSFFRASDNATAEEIVNEETPGAGYEREQKYVNNITFKDGLDEDTIKQWISDKRPEGTAGDSGNTAAKEAPNFGSKRFGKTADA